MKKVIRMINNLGCSYTDLGCYGEDNVYYFDIAFKVANVVIKGDSERGNLICSTGIGTNIAANKIRGIRVALYLYAFSALRTRKLNNTNIPYLGAKVVEEKYFRI